MGQTQCMKCGYDQPQNVHMHVTLVNKSSTSFQLPTMYYQSGLMQEGHKLPLTLPKYESKIHEFTCRKSSGAAFGTQGLFVYRICDSQTRLAIMFSTPYNNANHNFFGFSLETRDADNKMYYNLYHDKKVAIQVTDQVNPTTFKKQFAYASGKFTIIADMSYPHKSIFNIAIWS